MSEICINMIVRNGDDFLEQVLKSVLPYADRVRIGLDSRTNDKTREVLQKFKVEVVEREIKDPKIDLVLLRNDLLEGVKEKYVWIVDSDEFYPLSFFLLFLVSNADVYTFQCHAPWTKVMGHRASAKAKIPRIFKNDGRRWIGRFGKEKLHKAEDRVVDIPFRYIHLTHLKKDRWREEMGQRRVADGKSLYRLPEDIISQLNKII